MSVVRLGGFVLFRNNARTLDACLTSLHRVCDEVVAIDTGSADGSAALAQARGTRRLARPWRGYGEARAAAAEALRGCDYLFYLDSDERSHAALEAWRLGAAGAAAARRSPPPRGRGLPHRPAG